MDTLEWGNTDDLYDLDDLDLEQYGFQAPESNFQNNSFLFNLADDRHSNYSNEQTYRSSSHSPESKQESQSFFGQGFPSFIKEEPMQDSFYVPELPYGKKPKFNSEGIPPPPSNNLFDIQSQESEQLDIVIDRHPPVEVRTRTPSEIRTFCVSGRVLGPWKRLQAEIMRITLYYERNDVSESEPVKKDILGGTKTVPVLADGTVIFDNLTISESSTKHKEREFYLMFTLLRTDGLELLKRPSKPFYAYSHKKVLQRRGSVKLRTLSRDSGSILGGEEMHVIGSPFIQGPALSIFFRTPHGDVHAKPIEFFSDSVLFFRLPPYPLPEPLTTPLNPHMRQTVSLLVTNDGRTFSNPLEFTYVVEG